MFISPTFQTELPITASTMAGNAERTFIMIKPDGVHRGICGEIIKRFENKGFKLVAMKFMQASEEHLKNHYADLSSKVIDKCHYYNYILL